jgi:hypothetical protein
VTAFAPLFSTSSRTVNMYLSSTARMRLNTSPAPLSHDSVTGMFTPSVWPSAVQTVSLVGSGPAAAPTQPNSA